MRRYTKQHAWVLPQGDAAVLGLTDYAQQQLGDIVFVDLPTPGSRIESGQAMGTVESVKSVSELIAPVSGSVTEVNTALADTPEALNQDPEGAAWLLKVKLTAPDELASLLDAAAYAAFLGGGG